MEIMMKKCVKCANLKKVSEFYKHKKYTDGCRPICKKCTIENRRTPYNKARILYDNLNARSRKHNMVVEFSKQEFIDWCMQQSVYHTLHKKWSENDYIKWYAPSIDRKNDYKPYTFENMRLMSWHENSKKGNVHRKTGVNNKHSKEVICIDEMGTKTMYFSTMEAERNTKVSHSHISKCCNGVAKTAGGYRWEYTDK